MANKWIPLDGKKEPPFNSKMLILIGIGWQEVMLLKVEIIATGKEYTFCKVLDKELTYTNATHFMLIEPPKNNQ